MGNQQRFPAAAVVVLIVGLVVVVTVILVLSFPVFYPAKSVNSIVEAKEEVEGYLTTLSADLRVKEIMEFSTHFYIMVQEKSTSINAMELLVDRATGRIFFELGPNMMWNTKYGHMTRFRDSTPISVTPEEALQQAQSWLDKNFPIANAEEPEMFYGYYTLDFSKNSSIIGMLSVNGYSGDIWLHIWHGKFIQMVEYH